MRNIIYLSWFSQQRAYSSNTYMIYIETLVGLTSMFFIGAFCAAYMLSLYINLPFFSALPSTDKLVFTDVRQHIHLLFQTITNHIFNTYYSNQAHAFHDYIQVLRANGLAYLLYTRLGLSLTFASWVGYKVAGVIISNPIKANLERVLRGMQVYEGKEAIEKITTNPLYLQEAKSDALMPLAKQVNYYSARARFHQIVVGASGTGKSQLLFPAIEASINSNVKTIVLDPKSEFLQKFMTNSNQGLLNPTDARSLVWAIWLDMTNKGVIASFFNSIIPDGGDNPMWSSAAREIGISIFLFLNDTFKDGDGKPNWNWKDVRDISLITDEQLYLIAQRYNPTALKLIGQMDADTGKLETNVTTAGIMINFTTFMAGFFDIARYWGESKNDTISLHDFILKPQYKYKDLFIVPDASQGKLSNTFLSGALSYILALIDSPNISDSKNMRAMFFLDEFHQPGALMDGNGRPLIDSALERGRSRGFGIWIAVQSLVQLEKIYDEKDVTAWRETASNLFITGIPTGESANKLADMLGTQVIEKQHVSMTYQPDGMNRSVNYQQHNDEKVMLGSEMAQKLGITRTGIKYLYLPRGYGDAYILEREFVAYEDVNPAYIPAKEKLYQANEYSKLSDHLNTAFKTVGEGKTKANLLGTHTSSQLPNVNLIDEYAEFEDYFTAHTKLEEEVDYFARQAKIYDLPAEGGSSVTTDALKEMAINSMVDSHAITHTISLLEELTETSEKTTSKAKYQEIKSRLAKQQHLPE